LSGKDVWSLLEDRKGAVWVTSTGGKLDRLDPHSRIFRHYRLGTPDPLRPTANDIYSRVEDPSGILWLGTDNAGLFQFDPRTEKFLSFPNKGSNPKAGLKDSHIMSLWSDTDGTLWAASSGKGLFQVNTRQGLTTSRLHPDLARSGGQIRKVGNVSSPSFHGQASSCRKDKIDPAKCTGLTQAFGAVLGHDTDVFDHPRWLGNSRFPAADRTFRNERNQSGFGTRKVSRGDRLNGI
jgi:hypothetical protein